MVKGFALIEVVSMGIYEHIYPDLYDTLVCSFLRAEEFELAMEQKSIDERSVVLPSKACEKDTVYYVDSKGHAYKYLILEEHSVDN